jgi:Concanavalin A-like lectin/glucanases superfamily
MVKSTLAASALLFGTLGLVACGGSASINGSSASGGRSGVGSGSSAGASGFEPELGGGLPGGGPGVGTDRGGAGDADAGLGMAGYSSVTGPDGLRANYHFDETKGAFAVDSVSQNHGTIALASRIQGVSGNALGFSSAGSRVELPALGPFAAGELSVEFWLRPASLAPDAIAHLVGDGGGGVQSFRVELEGGNVAFLLSTGDGAVAMPVAKLRNELTIAVWQLVTVTFDGSSAHIYLDGVDNASASVVASLPTSANTIYVGALPASDYASYVDQLDGDMDELKIWNVALSPAQVAAHFPASP